MEYEFEEVRGELSPCLIGSTRTKNPNSWVRRAYFAKRKDTSSGAVYSIDNLRFGLHASPSKLQEILDSVDRYDGGTDDVATYTQGTRIGSYKYLWQWRYLSDAEDAKADEKSSVVMGYVLVKGNGGIDTGLGFLEFNPNKVGMQGYEMLKFLDSMEVRFDVVRWDLAIDYPVCRDMLRMRKDGRKYACEISDSMTEYLGQRNKPGRVKLYDKAAERGYVGDLTRIELTCNIDWNARGILSLLPDVYHVFGDKSSLRGVTRAFAVAVNRLVVELNEPYETWLRLVDHKTAAKIRNVLSSGFTLQYSEEIIGLVLSQVHMLENLE